MVRKCCRKVVCWGQRQTPKYLKEEYGSPPHAIINERSEICFNSYCHVNASCLTAQLYFLFTPKMAQFASRSSFQYVVVSHDSY